MISIATLVAPSKPSSSCSCLLPSYRFHSHLVRRSETGKKLRYGVPPPPSHRSSTAASGIDSSVSEASICKTDVSSLRVVASHSVLWKCCCHSREKITRPSDSSNSQLHLNNSRSLASQENVVSRRIAAIYSGTSLVSIIGVSHGLTASPIKAQETNSSDQDESDSGVVGVIKSIFDPNEKTKSGKVLPKAYLKSAREVVKTLRESLEEDSKDVAKFRRTADAAKESIREYLSNWRGQKAVINEESYAAIEKAIRSLANFYSKAGPFATMTEEAKTSILDYLKTAEASL